MSLSPELRFQLLCKANRLTVPMQEFCFAPPRKFRFDYCWPEHKVALEVEGGIWTNGRHVRGSGYTRDLVKYNLAASLGYRLFRVPPRQLCTEDTIRMLKAALG